MEIRLFKQLKPFNLEEAKRGEPVCTIHGGNRIYICDLDDPEHVAIRKPGVPWETCAPVRALRMAPLTWIEGRPVYRGDTLYGSISGYQLTVTATCSDKHGLSLLDGTGVSIQADYLTWDSPVKANDGQIAPEDTTDGCSTGGDVVFKPNLGPLYCANPAEI